MNELTIIKHENISIIANLAPQSYTENQISHTRCLDAGRTLLDTIRQQGGMTDELDRQAALYIDRARKTVSKMNEKRSPVTKLFVEIRRAYTVLENEVNPTTRDTIPYKLQQLRNEYAAKKRAEAEAKRQEEKRRLQRRQSRDAYKKNVELDYKAQFTRTLNMAINDLTQLNATVTLDNYAEHYDRIKSYPTTLPANYADTLTSSVPLRLDVEHTELAAIRAAVLQEHLPKFGEQYTFEIESNRDNILDMLPSKKRNLEKAAQASAEEAARIKAVIAAREAEEARHREEAARAREQASADAADMNNLFSAAQASVASYHPKTAVKKRLVPLNAEAFPLIIMQWWQDEGNTLPVEELAKLFKRQITHCEKLANDKNNPVQFTSEHIAYEDEVKAK